MSIEVVTLREPRSGATAAIAPKLGFNCFSFRVGEQEALWSDPEFLAGQSRPSRTGIPILFPFAGRIRGGKFRFQDRDYELEAADGRGNAIHGFVYTRPWRVISQTENSVTGEFQASVDDPTILSRWPSDFRIRATYTVQNFTLAATYEFTNTGDRPMPWWFGTHPYFRAGASSIVQYNVGKRWLLDDLVPTGEQGPVEEAGELSRGAVIGSREFDDVYTELHTTDGVFMGTVTDSSTKVETTIRFGEPFRECVVFIPPHREAICLEPYTSVPNAFELAAAGIDTGLAVLPVGETMSVSVHISVRG